MPNPSKQLPTGRPRRRGSKAETRERLVTATLELLHGGGEAAVSTVSVTRAAGIAQSAFYQHFANVEECLAVAAERVTRQIREAVADARRQMMDEAGPAAEDHVRFYRDVFDLVSRQRPVVRLFLRYRSDPLALNGVMYRFARDLSSDLARQLAELAGRAGLHPLPADRVEALADNLMAAGLAAVEAHLEGRGPAVEESARLLAAFSSGACGGVFEALRPGACRPPAGAPRRKTAQ
jgi:AcrR family transcriptional regulator